VNHRHALIFSWLGIKDEEVAALTHLDFLDVGLEFAKFGTDIHADKKDTDHSALSILDGAIGSVVILAEQFGFANITLASNHLRIGRVFLAQQGAKGTLAIFLLEGRRHAQEIISLLGKQGCGSPRSGRETIHFIKTCVQYDAVMLEQSFIILCLKLYGSGKFVGQNIVEAHHLFLHGIGAHFEHALDQLEILMQFGAALLLQHAPHAHSEQLGAEAHDHHRSDGTPHHQFGSQ